MRGIAFGLAAAVVVAAGGGGAAQGKKAAFDQAVFDREKAAITKLGKRPLLVYSADETAPGSVSYDGEYLAARDGATVYLHPLGWATNTRYKFGPAVTEYVVVCVGPAVKVGDAELKKGEYAAVRGGKLVKLKAADLKK